MHLPINVKSPNNISNWQMEFNSAFKRLIIIIIIININTPGRHESKNYRKRQNWALVSAVESVTVIVHNIKYG
jgi:hypothetical protein